MGDTTVRHRTVAVDGLSIFYREAGDATGDGGARSSMKPGITASS